MGSQGTGGADASAAATFAAAADEFCVLVEGDLPPDRQAFIVDAREALARLYLAGLTLPAVEAGDDAVVGDSTNEWRVLYARLQEYLGEADTYWEVFDPYALEDPVAGSLADDLADVVGDVKRGAELIHAGRVDAALWEWRFHFWFHWAHHAVDALRALTRIAPDEDS